MTLIPASMKDFRKYFEVQHRGIPHVSGFPSNKDEYIQRNEDMKKFWDVYISAKPQFMHPIDSIPGHYANITEGLLVDDSDPRGTYSFLTTISFYIMRDEETGPVMMATINANILRGVYNGYFFGSMWLKDFNFEVTGSAMNGKLEGYCVVVQGNENEETKYEGVFEQGVLIKGTITSPDGTKQKATRGLISFELPKIIFDCKRLQSMGPEVFFTGTGFPCYKGRFVTLY